MYKGTNKIALVSKQAIQKALIALMDEKDYQEITISELCKKAHISRQTFYSLFQTKEAALLDAIPRCEFSSEGSSEQRCSRFYDYLFDNYHILSLLAENGMLHLIFHSLRSSVIESERGIRSMNLRDRLYTGTFIACALVGVAMVFISNQGSDSREYLVKRLKKLFNGDYVLGGRL